MLVITGSGDVLATRLGSGLTEKSRLEHVYYSKDCKKVGVEHGPSRLPIKSNEWETKVPEITKPDSSFYNDKMELRKANLAYDCGHTQKIIDNIRQEIDRKVPDITKPAEKLDPLPADSLYSDEDMKEMDIRVANMAYYHGHTQKLIDDINQETVAKSALL